MKKLFNVLLIGFLSLYIFSCTKDEEVVAESKTDILVSTPWVINSANFIGLTVYSKGGASNLYDASKISLTFKKDGTISATDLSGLAVSGTWAFTENETKITLPPGLPFKEIVIDGLSKTNFDISIPSFSVAILGTTQTGKLSLKMVPKV